MPDYTFISQPQVPESFRKVSEALNIMRSGVELQKSRATMEADIAQRRAESARAVTESDVSSQTAQPRITQSQQAAQKAITEANAAAQSLTQDQRGIVAGVIGTLGRAGITDREVYKRELSNLKTVNPDNAGLHKIIDSYHIVLDNMPKDSDITKGAIGVSQFLLTPQQAQAGMTPQAGTVGLGGTVNQAITTPSVMGAPTTLQPGQLQQVDANPITGNPQVTEKSPAGAVTAVRPAPVAAGVPVMQPGDREAIPKLTELRGVINAQAARVPESKFNNEQIIKLADNTNLGKGSQTIANLRGQYAALPWTNDSASNYNVLGHFIARESANMAQAMGANTDSARQLAQDATVSKGWTSGAVKSAAKVNNALVTGLENFNKGMEKAVAANGGNVLAVRDFQNAWSSAFDPNVYRFANALESGDKAEIAKILGPVGSPQRAAKAADLARKSSALYRLSNEGR